MDNTDETFNPLIVSYPKPQLCFAKALCVLLVFVLAGKTNGSEQTVDNNLIGKVVAGYQGWFAAKNDGMGMGWVGVS